MNSTPTLTEFSRHRIELPLAEQWVLRSHAERRTYRIMVAQPMGSPPPSGFPVIYLLDGNSVFSMMVDALRLQCRRPDKTGVLPAIVVGIGYETNGPYAPDRFYDFTPLPAEDFKQRSDGTPLPEQGGAGAFLQFIEEELKPQIESEFQIDRDRQALFGHSLGGLFTIYTLFSQPEAFRYYIAGSPSLHWNPDYMQELEQNFIEQARMRDRSYPAQVLLGVGELEKTHVCRNCERASELANRLSAISEDIGVEAEYKEFEQEGHVSVLPILVSRALRFVLNPDK
ncbi:alpha/beta hydrolase-fold protein [Paenibacillus alvei]|uniref:alpha/beta hydrolase n=1 Tax=Paenibacillus alvei TaxID=44250 RepID=UPI003D2DA5DF